VGNFGLLHQGFDLIARLDGQPQFAVSNEESFHPDICQWYLSNEPAHFWSSWFAMLKPRPDLNFPYGWNVEPD